MSPTCATSSTRCRRGCARSRTATSSGCAGAVPRPPAGARAARQPGLPGGVLRLRQPPRRPVRLPAAAPPPWRRGPVRGASVANRVPAAGGRARRRARRAGTGGRSGQTSSPATKTSTRRPRDCWAAWIGGPDDDRCHLGPEVRSPDGQPALARTRHDLVGGQRRLPEVPRRAGAGGAILVYSDDRQALLGVLTRDPAVFGDARLAHQIEVGNLPPLEQLLEHAVDDPAA